MTYTNEESQPIFAPKEMHARVTDLIECEKEGDLSITEKSELDYYLKIEHLMRLIKAKLR